MKLTIEQIARAFSSHKFESTYPYLLDNIQWNLVGDKMLAGKENIINTYNESAQYLTNVITRFDKFKVVAGDNCVVIDSLAEYVNEEQKSSTVSSCDIYKFIEGKLSAITSYCIELNKD